MGRFQFRTVITCLAVLLATASCAGQRARSDAPSPGSVATGPGTAGVVLYAPGEGRLVDLDVRTGVSQPLLSGRETFQYPVPGSADLYTSGDSDRDGFQLIRVSDGHVVRLLSVPGPRGLFPLAPGGWFLLDRYGRGNRQVAQQIVRLSGGRLRPLTPPRPTEITAGAQLGDRLYLMDGRPRSNTYALEVLDLDHPAAVARTVETGLISDQLASFAGHLIVDAHLRPGSVDPDLAGAEFSAFPDGRPFAVTLGGASGGNSAVTVLDPLTGRRLGQVRGDIVGFIVTRRRVDVYGPALSRSIPVPG